MIGLTLIFIGVILRFVGWLLTPRKLYTEADWNADVAKAMHRLNLEEAARYARQCPRQVVPERN